MAKKTSGNAVKKIDDQIEKLKANSSNNQPIKKTSTTRKTSSTSTRKSTAKKSNTRDKVVVAPTKKSTTTKKTTSTSKNVRGGVVSPAKKKKTTTKTISKEKIKNELQDYKTKKEKVQVVASREKKKQLESEVNKILEIEDSYNVRDIELPKFIQEDKPEVEELKEDLETRVKEFLETEDEKEIQKVVDEEFIPSAVEETPYDDVNVIKFSDKKPMKKGNLKKKTDQEDLKLEKPIDLDEIDKIEEFKIVEEFEQDIPKTEPPVTTPRQLPKKQEFTRKRKGKGYVVTKKPTYHELESDLRSLYDKVGDVVGDFDEGEKIATETTTPATTPSKKFVLFPKKKKETTKVVPKKTVPPTPVYKKKKKVVREEPIVLEEGERPSLLDHISQRVLNFFLIVLFTIFGLMTIAFIGFVIYVSTF